MRPLLVALSLAAALPAAQGARAGANPIGKVLELIGNLQAKVIQEGEEAQKLYDEFAEWCEDRSKDLGFEVKTAQADSEALTAAINEEEALSASLNTKIGETAGSISEDEADLKAATAIREKEVAVFQAEEKELMEVVDMIERATGILERELKGGSLLQSQTRSATSLASALSTMVQAAMIGSEDASKLTALVQSAANTDDSDEMGAPDPDAYEGHSSSIIDTLSDLGEKAQTQLDECRTKETAALQAYEMTKQSLTDQIRFANKDLAEAKGNLAASAEKKSTAQGDLAVTTKDLKADLEAKSELHHECMTKAEDFETEVKDRTEELKALAEAKKIIQEMTGAAAAQSYDSAASFVQVSAKAKATSGNFEVARMIRELGAKHHAAALTQLASRISQAMHYSTGDPFEKIRGMISDMLEKLQGEADADATKKAYCDKEMGESTEKKSDKEDELEKLSTKIDQMTAESAKLKEEVAALQNSLSKLATSQAEMDKLRSEEKALFEKIKAEIEMGLEGVKKALSVLKEYYGKAEGGSSGGAGSGIIGLLEVCESDFSKDLAEIVSAEETAVATYETETKENEIEKATKEGNVKFKTKESASLDKASAEATSDKAGVKEEYDAVLEYFSKIQGECVAKPETYEERVKRRTAEIAGLKEALSVLENESAFIQQTSTHRALRGIHHHA